MSLAAHARCLLRFVAPLALSACMHSMAPVDREPESSFPLAGIEYRGPTNVAISAAELHDLDAALDAAAAAGAITIDPVQFDLKFRTGGHDYLFSGDLDGVNRARYPRSTHPNAAYSYVAMGVRYELSGARGAAARAYWAGLGLSSRSFASRRQREQIRRLAYAGLARLAIRKHQPEWAALLRLCAELAGTYADSDQAAEAHNAFYSELRSQIRTQERVEAERAAAHRSMILQGITAGLSVASSVATTAAGATDVNTMSQQVGQQMMAIAEISQESQQLDEATQQAMSEIAASVGALREVSAQDVPDLEAGKEFVARQVAWYLVGATDALPYIDGPLARYAAGRPPLAAALAAYRAAYTGKKIGGTDGTDDTNGTDDTDDTDDTRGSARSRATKKIEPLVKMLVEAERHVASFERFGITPGPRYLARVCAPGAGHPLACHLAAEDICRAGIGDGCAVLAALYAGGGDK